MVSDLVLKKILPDSIKKSVEAYVGCIAGAIIKDEYIRHIREAGFNEIIVVDETAYGIESVSANPTNSKNLSENAVDYVSSIKISATKEI